VRESGSVREPGRWAPIPWQEFADPLCGVIMQPGEHIGEPTLRIDVIELCALYRHPNYAERSGFPDYP
jgi:hypothetical protein